MSYTPDKKEIRRVYSQGTTGEPINEWADEFDRWLAAEIAAAEKRGAVKALRDAAQYMNRGGAPNLFDGEEGYPLLIGKYNCYSVSGWLNERADRIEEGT